MFDSILESLNGHHRECFLIAPGLPSHKATHLAKQGIHYIDMTGEDFFDGLKSEIKDNAIADFQNGKLSSDTFMRYCKFNDAYPVIETRSDRTVVATIKRADGSIDGNSNWTVLADSELAEKMRNFFDGYSSGKLVIPKENLQSLSFVLAGLPFPEEKFSSEIQLESIPIYDGPFEVIFDDNFEVRGGNARIFRGNKVQRIEVSYRCMELIIFIQIQKHSVNVEIKTMTPEVFDRVSSGLDIFELLTRLFGGQSLKIPITGDLAIAMADKVIPNIRMQQNIILMYLMTRKPLKNILKFVLLILSMTTS
ncbi:hypothetical protein MKQ70_16550 [Chitinophaga sedimenti]|uniref:hypothetical protein n=1 Tax=Chitinophaga sedimenti TaxID=2033606 RepID=UPI002004F11D|nr:hypothetical protein [Chitinophaga sedimenti]MCK7556539.1 hypothetical protein [Chitinophaga sedimenti]